MSFQTTLCEPPRGGTSAMHREWPRVPGQGLLLTSPAQKGTCRQTDPGGQRLCGADPQELASEGRRNGSVSLSLVFDP